MHPALTFARPRRRRPATRSTRSYFLLLVATLGADAAMAAKRAPDVPVGYRFGEWTLLLPPAASPAALGQGPVSLGQDGRPVEALLYWGKGDGRALALRFAADGPEVDTVTMRGRGEPERLEGCRTTYTDDLPPLDEALPDAQERVRWLPELPDDSALRVAGTTRGLRRLGDELIADLATYRVVVAADDLVVFIGNPVTGENCYWKVDDDLDSEG